MAFSYPGTNLIKRLLAEFNWGGAFQIPMLVKKVFNIYKNEAFKRYHNDATKAHVTQVNLQKQLYTPLEVSKQKLLQGDKNTEWH